MKITYTSFKAEPLTPSSFFLLHGNDNGKVKDLTNTIKNRAAIENIHIIDTFINEETLRQMLQNKTFSGKAIFKIHEVPTTISKTTAHLLESYAGENIIIFITSSLSITSPIRKFFEQSTSCVCIGCYTEQNQSMTLLNLLKKHNLRCDARHTFDSLVQLYAGCDSSFIASEIEKISLYVKNKTISKHVIPKTAFYNSQKLNIKIIDYIITQSEEKFLDAMYKILLEKHSCIPIFRELSQHLDKLSELKEKMHKIPNIETAMNKLSSPVFFIDAKYYKTYIKNLSERDIYSLKRLLLELELLILSNALNSKLAIMEMYRILFLHPI